MATTSRQTTIFGIEDWKQLYQTYNQADFQSYNFETLRKSFIDYLQIHHPETFNDYVESSEFIALLDLIAFMGQGLSFRQDLNTRENFLDTAERRDSVVNLANLVGYNPKRNENSTGYLKVVSVNTTQNIYDYNNNSLSNVTIRWNDQTNIDWQEQFNTILNATFVDSQRIGNPGRSATILDVDTDEYTIRIPDNVLPILPFNSTVDGINMAFEVVNSTSIDKTFIYEPAPSTSSELNLLYRNDNLGFASSKTGYFFYFKQGSLESKDFVLSERIANREVQINVEGINNSDVWLYELDDSGSIISEWTQVDNIYATNTTQTGASRKFFSITNRASDQISLNFGDSVFGDIPVGTFRVYIRGSNGLDYVINPQDMLNVTLSIQYVSRLNRIEVATFTVQLAENVSNSRTREDLDDIKRKAPARYYTQNRMVNGEDYNNFPYSSFNSIIKSKAINRSNIGASRYLDLVDPTGKFSSINTFGADGMLYREDYGNTFGFSFVDTNDIESVIRNQVEDGLSQRGVIQFYNQNYPRYTLSPTITIEWNFSTMSTNQTTGYFKNTSGTPLQISEFVTDNKKFLKPGCIIKFEPPAGYHFDKNNRLQADPSVLDTDKTEIWVGILSLKDDGTNFGVGNDEDGVGPVVLNDFVPSDAIPTTVIAKYSSDLDLTLEQSMLAQIELYRDFGIGYDNDTGEWYLINSSNLDPTSDFSLTNAQSTANSGLDASWVAKFIASDNSYTVSIRELDYYFASVFETRFYLSENEKIYDPKTGKTVNDHINVLRTNSQPDSNDAFTNDYKLDIISQPVEIDGFTDNYKVQVSFTDSDDDSVADNPDFFEDIIAPTTNPNTKNVFLQTTLDADNLERKIPLASNVVNTEYGTLADIQANINQFNDNQVFYAYTDAIFYELSIGSLITKNDYEVRIGRSSLTYQYKHNSSETRRINPGVSNIIDIFLVTTAYYNDYRNYITDTTGSITEPAAPDIDELTTAYGELNTYKMISDNLVLNSAKFKTLFGDKADTNLQAYIKIVKLRNSLVSTNEIKSKVITAINEYFNITNWDFGDTFYFSELSAYLHDQIGDIMGSVVLTPKDPSKSFGDLYEIKSAPNEIFVSAATVNDILVIDSLVPSQLNG